MSSSQNRQYEGFTYPGSTDGASAYGAYPYHQASAAATPLGTGSGAVATGAAPMSGLIRRSTSATAGGAGYNYFHQHTNSTGGHSAFGSESGSLTSGRALAAANNPASTAAGATLVAVSSAANGYTASHNTAANTSTGSANAISGSAAHAFRGTASVSSTSSHPVPFVQSTPTSAAMQFVDFNAGAPPASVGVSGSHVRSPRPFHPPAALSSHAGTGAGAAGTSFLDGEGTHTNSGTSPQNASGPARQPFAQAPPGAGPSAHAQPGTSSRRGDAQGYGSEGRGRPNGGGMLARFFGSMLNDADGAVPAAGDAPRPLYQTRFGFPDDDLPLLDELGINPKSILKEARVVLNPLGNTKVDPKDVTDLAGPLVFVVALAFLLSLQKKAMQFSAIYGLSVVGLVFFKILLSLMSSSGVSIIFVMSALGYALLPSLLLALLRTVVQQAEIVVPCAVIVLLWSSWCATALLVKGLGMETQRFLILYPVFLFYAVFATLTIF